MTERFTARVTIAAPPAVVYEALTDPAALRAWFAEYAEVDLTAGRYDFWGRHTPGTPSAGCQRLLGVEPEKFLRYAWTLGGVERPVDITLSAVPPGGPRPPGQRTRRKGGTRRGANDLLAQLPDETLVVVDHPDGAGDFWVLALAGLADHVEGRVPLPRLDYTEPAKGTARLEATVAVPPDRVFAALTDPAALREWLLAGEGAVVEPRVGGRYDAGWEHGPVEILLFEQDRLLVYSWRYRDTATTVRWELSEVDGGSRVRLVHSGFADHGLAEEYRQGWPGFLVRLKRMLEHGPGWRSVDASYTETVSPVELH